jgi:hypothetical protein
MFTNWYKWSDDDFVWPSGAKIFAIIILMAYLTAGYKYWTTGYPGRRLKFWEAWIAILVLIAGVTIGVRGESTR